MADPDTLLTRVLRHVDGVPHVVFGPLTLFFAEPLARLVGVDEAALRLFLLGFTVYGVVVVLWLRASGPTPALVTLAVIANVIFAVLVIWSLGASPLTAVGTLVHALVLLSAAGVTKVLVLADLHRRVIPAC